MLSWLGYCQTPSSIFITTELLQESLVLASFQVSTLGVYIKNNHTWIEPTFKLGTDNCSQFGIKATRWKQNYIVSKSLSAIQAGFSSERCGSFLTEKTLASRYMVNERYHFRFGGRIIPDYIHHPTWGLGAQLAVSLTPETMLLRHAKKELIGSIEIRTPWGLGTFNGSLGAKDRIWSERWMKGIEVNWSAQKSNLRVIAAFYRRQHKNFDEPLTGYAWALRYQHQKILYSLQRSFDNFNRIQWPVSAKYSPHYTHDNHLRQFLRQDFETNLAPVRFNSSLQSQLDQTNTPPAVIEPLGTPVTLNSPVLEPLKPEETPPQTNPVIDTLNTNLWDKEDKLRVVPDPIVDRFGSHFAYTYREDEDFILDDQEIAQLTKYAHYVPSRLVLQSLENYEAKPLIQLQFHQKEPYDVVSHLEDIQSVIRFMKWIQFLQLDKGQSL